MKEKQRILDHKEHQSLNEFAETLEVIAKKLKDEASFTLQQGDREIDIAPNSLVEVEYSYKIKGDKHEFEIELEWREDGKGPITIK